MPFHETDSSAGGRDLRAVLTTWAEGVAAGLAAAAPAEVRFDLNTRSRLAAASGAEHPPAAPPHATAPARFADAFEVLAVHAPTNRTLAAVMFVGADHKADSDGALVFAVRVAAALMSGASVVVVDIAPGPAAWATHLNTLAPVFPITRRPRGPGASVLLCVPHSRGGVEEYHAWYHTVPVGGDFPTVLVPLRGDESVKLDLEATSP